jgi:MoaD family protein
MVGGRSVTAEGATVGEVLDSLDSRFQGFKEQVADNGQMRRFVNIFLNDEDIRFLQELSTPVKDGDVVSILPAMSGGC